jgi:hypothetical protein
LPEKVREQERHMDVPRRALSTQYPNVRSR